MNQNGTRIRTFIGGGKGPKVDLSVVTAGAGDVLSGKVIVDANGNPIKGSIKQMSGRTITPSKNNITVNCKGCYMTSDIIVPKTVTYNSYRGAATTGSDTKVFKTSDGKSMSLPYWTVDVSGFSIIMTVCWRGTMTTGFSALSSRTSFYMTAATYDGLFSYGGDITSTRILLPAYKPNDNILYFIYGRAS